MTASDEDAVSMEVIEGTFDLAREGRTGPLSEMIDAGVPLNLRNPRGDTFLIVAAYAGHNDTVAELLRRGAQTDIANANGHTAITCAVFRRNEELLRMLLDAGADPDAGGRTAAEVAAQFHLADINAVLEEYASR